MKEQKKRSRIIVIGIWLLCVIGLLNSQSLVARAMPQMTEDGNWVTEDGYRYTLACKATVDTTDDEVIIIGYIGEANELHIPSTIDGISVKSIGDSAFYNCSNITKVTIPDSVTHIGHSAFDGCTGLKSISIPNSVTYIGHSAFFDCSGLTSVTIPKGVRCIKAWTFCGCTRLARVTISNGVGVIDDVAFGRCSSLKSIIIPNSVITIGTSAFTCCKSLKSVTIQSKDLTFIGCKAFYGCKKLKTIRIKSTILDKKSVGSNALTGTNKKLTIKVPKKMVKRYKRYFKNKGNKTVRVKMG